MNRGGNQNSVHQSYHNSDSNQSWRDSPWWLFIEDLPRLNKGLLSLGTLCIGVGFLKLVGPPVVAATSSVVHPFTVAGKAETCLSHLQSVAQALAQYSGDHDGRFPPLDYQTKQGSRATWVSLLGQGIDRDNLLCPVSDTSWNQTDTISSYGLSPVLAGRKRDAVTDAAGTLLLADRADRHDVSLLPPFASWPKQTKEEENTPANLAFRHNYRAAVLYADGHAGSTSSTGWLSQASTWGGALLFHTATERLSSRNSALGKVIGHLQARDKTAALQVLQQNPKKVRSGTAELLGLWKQNTRNGSAINSASSSVISSDLEKLGWRLAGLWKRAGDLSFEQVLNAEQSLRSQKELQVQSGSWSEHSSDWGFSLSYPTGWTVQTSTEGRYRNTFFRSASPHIYVLVERGERTEEETQSTIDWSGMESDLKERYGKSYKRIRKGEATLGGEAASDWEFDLQKPDGPKLRKLYLGISRPWESYVVVCTAPAADFKAWQPTFDTLTQAYKLD
ncbi:MAG TPA: hypothetical protein VF600_01160 [Abditibacteriaceae bacterium]|jgi:prepilin-type processing-associated H-X9-DG protein